MTPCIYEILFKPRIIWKLSKLIPLIHAQCTCVVEGTSCKKMISWLHDKNEISCGVYCSYYFSVKSSRHLWLCSNEVQIKKYFIVQSQRWINKNIKFQLINCSRPSYNSNMCNCETRVNMVIVYGTSTCR